MSLDLGWDEALHVHILWCNICNTTVQKHVVTGSNPAEKRSFLVLPARHRSVFLVVKERKYL